MRKPVSTPKSPRRKGPRFPWLLLALFLASVYLLWIMPLHLGARPVEVRFEGAGR